MSQKILVIEDNIEMRENISDILTLASYEILTASNGREGVVLAQQNIPDLILCDIIMPELDGYGVLHILSKDKKTSDIPFIFLTAKAEKADFRIGMNLGADDYITKPFEGLDLLNVIEKRLQKNYLLKTSFQQGSLGINDITDERRQLKELNKLLENQASKTYKKKEMIFLEDRQPHELYYLKKGLVKTYKSTRDGKELVTGFLEPGSFLGYISLLKNKTYTESAVVIEEAEILSIPKQEFLSALFNNKEIAVDFIKILSNRLFDTENRMLELAYFSIRQRTAIALLQLHEQFQNSENENFLITISRKDIADLVGTATESLNRTLADFKEEGVIEIHHHGIIIREMQKLKKAII
ncbi:response regulator [Marivirga salinae]|uniref:Response regulator n=1 Tax=Marivirga salinarum TaxID=3059078 RepID=A0AA49GB05_9BACT|nr:response regulator [Marivirga sp. BDSF4-3]WKK76991.2 response regulator [Marivirga sp. BDSF4-3]